MIGRIYRGLRCFATRRLLNVLGLTVLEIIVSIGKLMTSGEGPFLRLTGFM